MLTPCAAVTVAEKIDAFKVSYAAPANGKRNTVDFYFDGTNWVKCGAQSPDL